MFKYLAILFLAVGFSLPAQSFTVSVEDIAAADDPCPDVDGKIKVKVTGVPIKINSVIVNIRCNTVKIGFDWNGAIATSNGEGESEAIILRNHGINNGNECIVYAVYGQSKRAKTTFEVTSQPPPPFEVSGSNSVTVGTEFAISKLPRTFVGKGPRFDQLVLRECTAATDPWIFLHIPYKIYYPDEDKDNLLVRVYPRLTTDGTPLKVQKANDNNDQCAEAYAYSGIVNYLVTVGDDYQGCKIKLLKREVSGGGTFNAQGDPTLDDDAAVTSSNGKIMLHTGEDIPTVSGTTISDTIEVQISNDGGYNWKESANVTGWTSAAQDTGIDAATDNADNMAMIRITDGTNVWWRIIKGQ